MPERPDLHNLDALLEDAIQRLRHATTTAKHPFHLGTIATVDSANQPHARTVVLRRVETQPLRLIHHTDTRSPKTQHIRHNPNACWLAYDPAERIQLRLAGRATLHTDDTLADEQWAASSLSSKRCYLAPHPPSNFADAPSPNLPEDLRDTIPTEGQAQPGRTNFAAICLTATSLDILHLAAKGHVRASYRFEPQTHEHTATWLHP
ncbi:pyridoxamine 5'-phosphate oxidase family protein [Mucisphaera sp.]|uniref:pyridoxamine 5'-phosphate oxidase family protein n=1 Tax=Mucisphaera sp. TaxID=2913024 RepID=UPI003D125B5F